MDWISETSDTEAMDKEASEILAKLEKIKPLEEKQKVALQNFQACSSKIEKFYIQEPMCISQISDQKLNIKHLLTQTANFQFLTLAIRD